MILNSTINDIAKDIFTNDIFRNCIYSNGKYYNVGLIVLYFLSAFAIIFFAYINKPWNNYIPKNYHKYGVYSNLYACKLNKDIDLDMIHQNISDNLDPNIDSIVYKYKNINDFLRLSINYNNTKVTVKLFKSGRIEIITKLKYEKVLDVVNIISMLIKKYDDDILLNEKILINVTEQIIARYYVPHYQTSKINYYLLSPSYKKFGIKICDIVKSETYTELVCDHRFTNKLIIRLYFVGNTTISIRINNLQKSDILVDKIHNFIDSLPLNE